MKRFVREDKNGTKIYADNTCQRCGGAGASDRWFFTGRVCYECGGSGVSCKETIIKVYTPEYQAKLDAKAKIRADKKQAELEAQKDQIIAREKAKAGFNSNDELYIVMGDNTYSIKDQIKADGGKWSGIFNKWFFTEPTDKYPTQVVKFDEVCEIVGFRFDWIWEKVKEAVKPKNAEKLVNNEYVGTIGERIELEVTIKATIGYDTQWGRSYIILMSDAEGHEFKWNSSSYNEFYKGDVKKIKGTIKAHEEYNNVKQTVLTRCKEVK